MQYSFYTLDVFTEQIFGGNPLAVFPEALGLSTAQMQAVAVEINYSETVFVLPPQTESGDYRLRIFTPRQELDFAGHPTLGTAFLLAHIGKIPLQNSTTPIILEEGVGPVAVTIYSEQGKPKETELSVAQLPILGPAPPSAERLASLLGLMPDAIIQGDYFPQAYSSGLPFLFVPLGDRRLLAQATLNLSLWKEHIEDYWASCLYLFTADPGGAADFQARMFAPGLGIAEDPATGSAVAALGGYLGDRLEKPGLYHWRIAQGIEMGRPSLLKLSLEKTSQSITSVTVAGTSVVVIQGRMEIPESSPAC